MKFTLVKITHPFTAISVITPSMTNAWKLPWNCISRNLEHLNMSINICSTRLTNPRIPNTSIYYVDIIEKTPCASIKRNFNTFKYMFLPVIKENIKL